MFLNYHAWDVKFSISNLQISFKDPVDNKPLISAASVKGALRSSLERSADSIMVKNLFGSTERAGHLYTSDFRLDPSSIQPEPQMHLHVALSRATKAAETDSVYGVEILKSATFRGTLSLRNGGVNPAVIIYHYLSQALRDIRLGQGLSRGCGSVDMCHMHRSDTHSEILLNPIEVIFRKSGHEIIKQIAARPELVYSLEWRDLERIIALTFEEIGYRVKLTQASHDGGKDIILYCLTGRDHGGKALDYYIEIKHWQQGTKVGKGVVKKLIDVSICDAVTGAAFISTSGYTDNLREESFSAMPPKLGDLATIRTLCQFYLASRSNQLFTMKSLEELFDTKWQD
jgi:CRISPR/Cas system CSM-associated protein Csm3 (group 7 of RAMP superfamily)